MEIENVIVFLDKQLAKLDNKIKLSETEIDQLVQKIQGLDQLLGAVEKVNDAFVE
jgi:prefoldin subunit 5